MLLPPQREAERDERCDDQREQQPDDQHAPLRLALEARALLAAQLVELRIDVALHRDLIIAAHERSPPV
jgi:hypothetical protein